MRIRNTCVAVAAALASLAVAQNASAQVAQDTILLDTLVVTATRLPTPLAEAPGAVTVITGADMRQRGTRLAVDALRRVPGVAVAQSAGPGALTSVFMRGGESDYVQVLVDGVQVNDPGGAYDWAHLRVDDIERIEIVRGPASVLYGSDAVAGVVQIFTRAGGAPSVEAGMTTGRGDRPDASGTFATTAFDASALGTATLGAAADELAWGFTASRLRSSGLYEFNSDYSNTLLSGRLRLTAGAADVAVTTRRTENRYHYPTSGSGAVVDGNQFATGSALSLGADAGYRISPVVELRLLATSHTNETRTENPPDNESDGSSWNTGDQTRRKLDVRTNIALPIRAFTLTAGVEREWQRGMTAFESVSDWGEYSDESDESRRNTGVYGQLHGSPLDNVSATLGARLDDNSAFGVFRTGRASASWTPASVLRLHAGAGTAFKEPTFFENYATGFTRGNPDLEPEESRSWEVGAEYTLADAVTVSATRFEQRFRNLIQYTGAPPTESAPNYENVGSARAHGVELGLRAAAGPAHITLAHTFTRTRVTDAGFGSDVAFQQDERLLRRPEHVSSASIAVAALRDIRLLADVRRVGSRNDLDFTVPQEWSGVRTVLPGYMTVDVGATSMLRRSSGGSVELQARIRNLFDERYTEIYNFPAPGRVFEVGLRAGTR